MRRKLLHSAVIPEQVAEVRRRGLTVQPLLGRHRPLQLDHVTVALRHNSHKLPGSQPAHRVI